MPPNVAVPLLRNDQFAIPPMRNGYFVRQPAANLLFRALDALLTVYSKLHRRQPGRPIERILVANGAHLGDVIVATSVLPALKAAFPTARIGFLVGSWSRAVVEGHPLVDRVHVVDHWRMNRSRASLFRKVGHYLATRHSAMAQLKAERYDVAIDLYFYFPNSIALIWNAGIPHRIGYSSGGFGPLLSDPLALSLDSRSMIDHHLALLRRLPGVAPQRQQMRPSVGRRADPSSPAIEPPYIVVHVGSGSPDKDWTLEGWKSLADRLIAAGHRLVFTGSGAREKSLIERVIDHRPEPLDLCGRLQWHEFVDVVAGACFVIGVDSAAGHVAAAVGVPGLVIGNGMNNPFLWRPASSRVKVTLFEMPCIPCYRKHGCITKDCIRALSAEAVFRQVEAGMAPGSAHATSTMS